jgi:hypothetical protein
MRVLIAALLGGVIVFFWGFVAHTLLPIGGMGVRQATAEEPVIAALRENLPGEGVYLVPGLAPELYEDEAATAAYSAKAVANPNAFIVYQPVGEDGMAMGDNLGKEAATNVVAALVVAWVLTLVGGGFGRRVAVSTAMGLFSWLTVSVPYWNWYRFPLDFTLGNLISSVVGWLLAGFAMAWWIGRSERRRR